MKIWMKRLTIAFAGLLALLLLIFAAAWWRTEQTLAQRWQLPAADIAPSSDPAVIARGEYLARTRHCTGCHGAKLGGTRGVDIGPVVQVYAPNLTAGGGGAFLHPTHDGAEHGTVLRPPSPPGATREFVCRPAWCFPHPQVSRALTRRNWMFGLRNWRLWTSLTILYMFVFYLWFVSFAGDGGRRALLFGLLFSLLCYSLTKLAGVAVDSVPIENLRRRGTADSSGVHGPWPKSAWPATLRGMLHGVMQSIVLAFGLTGVWSVLAAGLTTKLATLLRGGPLPEATQIAIQRFCFLSDAQFWPMAGFAGQPLSLGAVSSFAYELLHNLGVLLSLLSAVPAGRHHGVSEPAHLRPVPVGVAESPSRALQRRVCRAAQPPLQKLPAHLPFPRRAGGLSDRLSGHAQWLGLCPGHAAPASR
jgi:hypothetical protein